MGTRKWGYDLLVGFWKRWISESMFFFLPEDIFFGEYQVTEVSLVFDPVMFW